MAVGIFGLHFDLLWSQEDHVSHLRVVLNRQFEHQLVCELEKCARHQSSTPFFGFINSLWQWLDRQCTSTCLGSFILFNSSFRHNSSQESAHLAASSTAHTSPPVSANIIYKKKVTGLTAPALHCQQARDHPLPHSPMVYPWIRRRFKLLLSGCNQLASNSCRGFTNFYRCFCDMFYFLIDISSQEALGKWRTSPEWLLLPSESDCEKFSVYLGLNWIVIHWQCYTPVTMSSRPVCFCDFRVCHSS